jgi:hypothetical protein
VKASFSAAEGFDTCARCVLRNPRPDACERIGLFFAGGGEVVHVLEVEPVFGRGAEIFAEAQRSAVAAVILVDFMYVRSHETGG